MTSSHVLKCLPQLSEFLLIITGISAEIQTIKLFGSGVVKTVVTLPENINIVNSDGDSLEADIENGDNFQDEFDQVRD